MQVTFSAVIQKMPENEQAVYPFCHLSQQRLWILENSGQRGHLLLLPAATACHIAL